MRRVGERDPASVSPRRTSAEIPRSGPASLITRCWRARWITEPRQRRFAQPHLASLSMCYRHGKSCHFQAVLPLVMRLLSLHFRAAAARCALFPALSSFSPKISCRVPGSLCVLNVYTHRPLLPYGPLARPVLGRLPPYPPSLPLPKRLARQNCRWLQRASKPAQCEWVASLQLLGVEGWWLQHSRGQGEGRGVGRGRGRRLLLLVVLVCLVVGLVAWGGLQA